MFWGETGGGLVGSGGIRCGDVREVDEGEEGGLEGR